MTRPRKKRFMSALERVNKRIHELTELHGRWLEACRVATNTQEKFIARYRADEAKAQIDSLFRKRRKIEGGRKRDPQGKLF